MGSPSYWEKTTSRQMYMMSHSEPAKCFEGKIRWLCKNRGVQGKVYFYLWKAEDGFS